MKMRRRAALALTVVGIVALAWFALNLQAMSGPYGPLALILVGPYGLIAILTLVGARGLWTGRRWARTLGVVASLLALAWAGFDIVQHWPGRLTALGDPNISYNWALPEIWIPLPIAVGAAIALVTLARGADDPPGDGLVRRSLARSSKGAFDPCSPRSHPGHPFAYARASLARCSVATRLAIAALVGPEIASWKSLQAIV